MYGFLHAAEPIQGRIFDVKIMKLLPVVAILGLWSWAAQAQVCANSPLPVALLAHGSIAAGTVTVANDAVNLTVTVATTGDFTIATHPSL